jgi:4-amino-4-deoxy-L-arabinose transferase-like glycosyltransferase
MWRYRPQSWREGSRTSSVRFGPSGTILRSAVSAIVIATSMRLSAICQRIIASDTGILVLSALSVVALHTATNGQYGFHRDELATIDDARFLSWGYVVYTPITPCVARVSLTFFGASMIGLRLFAALAVGISMVLTGLMAREIGGRRPAQLVAAWAAAIAGPAVSFGYLFQYVSFDYLWWVLAAWVTVRLLKSGDQRWWLALGAVVGFGMMTKFTMVFLLAGIVGGIVLNRPRWLLSKWLWCSAAVALLIFLPNLIWQVRHNFITLDFLRFIHVRDVSLGRADGFLPAQVWATTNPVTVPLWIAGLYFLFFRPEGKRYRLIGWMYLTFGTPPSAVGDPADALSHRQRQTLLHLASLPHAGCRGRRLGRAMVGNPEPGGCRHHTPGGSDKFGD